MSELETKPKLLSDGFSSFSRLLQHKEVIGRILLLFSVRGFQVFLGLVTTFFLARTLSIEHYGQYQFVLSVLGIVSIFSLTEFANTLMQSIARGFTGSFRLMLKYPIMTSCLGSIVLLSFSAWFALIHQNPMLHQAFLLAACIFPVSHGMIIWRGIKIGEERFRNFTGIEMMILLATNSGIILTTFLTPSSYIGAIAFVMLVPAIANVIIIARALKKYPPGLPSEDGVIRHGTVSSAYMAFSRVSLYIDKLLLFIFVDAVSVALLVSAERISDLLKTAIQDTSTALAPKFAKAETYTPKTDFLFKAATLAFGAIMVIFAFTFMPFVLTLIYGENYVEAVPYAQLLIAVQAISNLASFQFRYIRSKLDTDNVRTIMVGVSVCRIALACTFIPLFGLKGAVLSTVLYNLILTGLTDFRIKRDYLNK